MGLSFQVVPQVLFWGAHCMPIPIHGSRGFLGFRAEVLSSCEQYAEKALLAICCSCCGYGIFSSLLRSSKASFSFPDS